MERQADQDLDRIRQTLLRMGGLVERMISEAMAALIERDSARAQAVILEDREVNDLEKSLDEQCQQFIARKQPMAIDMRFLVASMKIANDLERMGDSAVNVAQAVEVLNHHPQLKPYVDLPRLAEITQGMVRDALDAFVRMDSHAALEVCRRDDQADALYKGLFDELVAWMTEDHDTVPRALHLLLIARNYERIADHATNISEDVIYYVEGRDIRHIRPEDVEPA